MKITNLIAAFVFFVLFVPGKFAWSLTFTADLTPIRVVAAPGDVINERYTLTLGANERKTHFRIHAEDFYKAEDGSPIYTEPGHNSRSCANWIQINPVETTVNPGAKLDAKLSIVVPVGTKPGGYWCALTIDEMPDPTEPMPKGTGVRMYTSISIAVAVEIPPIERQARILSLQLSGPKAILRLADTGDCPILAQGRIEFLKSGADKPVATVPLPRRIIFCEPVNTALVTANLPDTQSLPSGHYLVRVLIDIGLDHYVGAQKEMDVDRDPDTKVTGSGAGS